MTATDTMAHHWPLFEMRLEVAGVTLRPVREADLPGLLDLLPDDYEHDPRPERWAGLSGDADHRTRLLVQSHWRALGTWAPTSWVLDFAVEVDGEVVGVQSLEADDFDRLRTVDSGSWLATLARGRGVGVAMRTAVLGLAFDGLGALAAVSSARSDNGPSLGVSRSLGYLENGVSLNASGRGLIELTHVRLPRAGWVDAGREGSVRISGLDACRPWFGLAPA